MILSRNFVKDYIDLDDKLTIKEIAEDMTRVGNEYDDARKFIDCTKLVIGEILECEDHPDSDHLHVCKVNVGDEILQIVCGAPNARTGLKVIVALAGATLPGGEIKKGSIRGVESNGMMCSIAELGLDNKFLKPGDKEGIAELGEDAIPGEDPIKYLGFDDEIVDFDLTANRGDLLSILGMAYELGAIYGKVVKDVEINHKEIEKSVKDEFKVDIQTENCKLFLAKKVTGVTIKESPAFIKNRLMACGIRPINNVVDISNYVMLELGQPLHFYDADTLGNTLVVRMAGNGEKLKTLDEEERILDENDIVIATPEKAVGLAGVMGGLDTEVEEKTTNIIIESAIFDGVKVRKTSKKIVRSEASNRFEKGLDPKRTYMAIERACYLLEKYADGKILKDTVVYDVSDKEDKKIKISYENINNVLGSNISKEEILDVFKRLGFKYEESDKDALVIVPTRRQDISIKEDLIEEVSRIYGVDNIESSLPKLNERMGDFDNTIRSIRHKMMELGLNETLTYILVNDKDVHKYTVDKFDELKLLDPLTEERNTLRYSVITSLVKTYEFNKAHSNKDISIFEIGKGFFKKNDVYGENQKVAGLMTGKYYIGLGNETNVDFYIVKGVIEELLDFLGYGNRYSFVEPKEIPIEFHPYQTAEINVNGDIVGIIGKLNPEYFDDVYAFEINLDKLLSKKVGKMKYKDISKFPYINKDLAMVVDKDIASSEIQMAIKKAAGSLLISSEVFDVYMGKGIPEGKKSIAYSLTFGANDRTLVDEEINNIMNKVIEALENKFKAELRK